MIIFKTQKELKTHLEALNKTIGFVPTMGALHLGHISLVQQAKKESEIVVCSIFVNPTQFNEINDFENYPVTHKQDIELLKNNACDILYLPESVKDVYLYEKKINIDLGTIATVMEGANRPGHFDGVVQVVSVLFEIVNPHKAFFGLKDFQQYCIIKKMVQELELNIEVIGCPIVREETGLAMSSRNALLSEAERKRALVIIETLQFLQKNTKPGNNSKLIDNCCLKLNKSSRLEYLTIADLETLQPTIFLEKNKEYRAFIVTRLGNVRLIDNIEIFA